MAKGKSKCSECGKATVRFHPILDLPLCAIGCGDHHHLLTPLGVGRQSAPGGGDFVVGVGVERHQARHGRNDRSVLPALHGFTPGDLIVDGAFTASSGREGALELLDRGVDAIFCGNDATAEGALESIRARDLSVPGDVALAGFDDVGFAAELDPPLTTIRQGVQEQGAEAARALFHLLRHRGGGPRPQGWIHWRLAPLEYKQCLG